MSEGYDATELYHHGRKRRGKGHTVGGDAPTHRLDKRASGGKLTAADHHALPAKDFALPGERYPVPDRSHAINALARVAQHGSSAEKAKVRAKVHAKFPDIGED